MQFNITAARQIHFLLTYSPLVIPIWLLIGVFSYLFWTAEFYDDTSTKQKFAMIGLWPLGWYYFFKGMLSE